MIFGFFTASTIVIAAVNVVLPWSTCPIVPTFTCGFVRSYFCFAMFARLLFATVLPRSDRTEPDSVLALLASEEFVHLYDRDFTVPVAAPSPWDGSTVEPTSGIEPL